MENQNLNLNNQNDVKKPKSKFWKFALIFCAVIVGILVLYVAGAWGLGKYRYWQDMKKFRAYEEGIKKWQQEDYEAAMADTYGGKTPQETLQMYIEAVEKGDYELASKYFIGDRQKEELNYLKLLDEDKINWFLGKMLKRAFIELDENQIIDEKYYRIKVKSEEPNIYYSEIEFLKYPNDIWKINKILPDNF